MSKNILVLPGTYWQIALIDKIREMGHHAFVVNPAPDSPAFSHADGHLQADIFDRKSVIPYGHNNHIDAVMSDQCDIAMPLIAELGREFNVPALDPETAALYTDKYLMRQFCCQHGIPHPQYRYCKTSDDAIQLLNEIGKPIIIKPLDSNASHGVFKCSTPQQVREKFDESLSYSRIEKAVLAERYIEGTEFTIDSVKTPNGHFTLAISQKRHFPHNPNIANELLFSHYNPHFDYELLKRTNNTFVNNTNLQFGFTHAEYKYENGQFLLIEIAARGGGNMISSAITQYLSGYDTYRYLIECATGDLHHQDFSIRPEYLHRAAVLKFFPTPNGGGIVTGIDGEEYLDSEPDIKHYRFNFSIGDTITDAVSDSARIGFYIAGSDTMDKLQEVMQRVEQTVHIKVRKA